VSLTKDALVSLTKCEAHFVRLTSASFVRLTIGCEPFVSLVSLLCELTPL